MPATGGSIETVNIFGRDFSPSADSDVNRKLGGYETSVEANGNKTARKILTAVPWSISGLVVECDDDNGDQEYLQAVANGKVFGPITITYVSGAVYQGVGSVTGELSQASMSATCPLELSGSGVLTKQ